MEQKPKRKDINKYVRPHACQKWFDIGVELDVNGDDGCYLDEIRDKYGGDKEECFNVMIGKWFGTADKSQLTWGVILDCLKTLDLLEAVQSVQENVLGGTALQNGQSLVDSEVMGTAVQSAVRENVLGGTALQNGQNLVEVAGTAVQTVQENILGGAAVQNGQSLVEVADTANPADSSQQDLSNKDFDSSPSTSAIEEPLSDGETAKPKPIVSGSSFTTDLPLMLEGPAITEDSTPQDTSATDYSLVLETGKEVRSYQKELAQPGKDGKNYIVVAPTGSGKTLVAALVISHHLQQGKKEDLIPVRKAAFIVEKRPLAQQQTKELQKLIPAADAVCCTGDDTGATVANLLQQGHHIIVCTAGKLFDDMKCGRVVPSDFSLLVFDECHHTRKKSPYAELMIRYLQKKFEGAKLPQVIGLTASPGAGDNPHLDKTVTIEHLVNLCALMDATSGIKTVREHKEELEEHTNKPDFNIESYKDRDVTEPFIEKVMKHMEQLEKMVHFTSPFEKWSQRYETQVQQSKFVLESSPKPDSRKSIRILDLLRCLCRALDIYRELQYEDAMSILEDTHLLKHDEGNQHEQELRCKLQDLVRQLKELPRVENPHLEKVKTILEELFSRKPKSRVMFFVRTKKHATSIYRWISNLPIAKELGIHPCMVVGQDAGTTGDGMTQAEQQNSFQSFREGRTNVLVVTSIGEEGIDVPSCNLVIRYQHVSNEIAKAQTLGRARAPGVSEGYTILSSQKKQMQEVKNGELLALVDEILLASQFPSGAILVKSIEKAQKIRLQKEEINRKQHNDKQSTYKAEDVQLLCMTCKTPACSAADIRVLNGNCYVVPGEEFQQKIEMTKHPKPIQKAAMSKTHIIKCKECHQEWGNSCIWPSVGPQFPVLRCKSFTFVVGQASISVKKWSDAPFILKDFDDFPKSPEDKSD